MGSGRNRVHGDFEGASVVAFKVKYCKDGKFRAGSFVSISLFKAARIEFRELKHSFRCLSGQYFSLLTSPFQGKEFWHSVGGQLGRVGNRFAAANLGCSSLNQECDLTSLPHAPSLFRSRYIKSPLSRSVLAWSRPESG